MCCTAWQEARAPAREVAVADLGIQSGLRVPTCMCSHMLPEAAAPACFDSFRYDSSCGFLGLCSTLKEVAVAGRSRIATVPESHIFATCYVPRSAAGLEVQRARARGPEPHRLTAAGSSERHSDAVIWSCSSASGFF